MKKRVNIDNVTANYYCGRCETRQEDVPIQEGIYDGPPMCLNCGDEMLLDEVYLNENDTEESSDP